jgi:hypothetical protein
MTVVNGLSGADESGLIHSIKGLRINLGSRAHRAISIRTQGREPRFRSAVEWTTGRPQARVNPWSGGRETNSKAPGRKR